MVLSLVSVMPVVSARTLTSGDYQYINLVNEMVEI